MYFRNSSAASLLSEYLLIPTAQPSTQALNVSVPRPQKIYFDEMQEEIALYVKLACLGDMSVEDALAACEKKCMDILEDYQ